MTLSETDQRKMRNYCQKVITSLLAPSEQIWKQEGEWTWCEDWEIIEMCKYLFNGDLYQGDPPPRRLRGNPLWSKQKIMEKVDTLMTEFEGSVTRMIDYMEARRHG